MKKNYPVLIFSLFAAILLFSCQKEVAPPAACGAIPNENQMAWHEHEQYAFVHFSTNTFTDKEWGYGDEPESVFNPTELNAEQWAQTCRDAGLKGIILTCKHHDGFCLWQSAYTEHSVKNSPWKDGKGDVVKEVSDACRKYGLFFGIYLSPWDRNHAEYAKPEYITYYRNQLTELLTNYGEVSEVWLDGANGGDGYYGGANEIRKIDVDYYDWVGTLEIIRRLAPKAVIFSDAGPDVRWCGNESGDGGETNWCTINLDTLHPGNPDLSPMLNCGEEDGKYWIPSEIDVSIRPVWFYHDRHNDKVKSPQRLFEIYMQSVGRSANLLLNLPPDRRGLLHENDVDTLLAWKQLLDRTFAVNHAENAKITADSYSGNAKKYSAKNAIDGNKETYWATDDSITAGTLEITFAKPVIAKYILLQEYIRLGQRVKSFEIEVKKGNTWEKAAEGTTIGYKRILPIGGAETSAVRVKITDSKTCPLISNVEIF
jgi:alpha-L-fucosidase